MELILKNDFMSLGGGSTVKTYDGLTKFKVKGKMFSATKKKWICDAQGRKLFLVRNKYWKFLKNKAIIYNNRKKRVCMLVNNLFTIQNAYTIEKCVDDIQITNQKISVTPDWHIYKNGVIIGSIGCDFKLVKIVDEFKINVIDETEAPFLVALAIALDNIRDKKRHQRT